MQGIFNNEQAHLNVVKKPQTIRTRMAVDIDGVLCDFVTAIYQKAVDLTLIEPEEVPAFMQNYEFPDIVALLYRALLKTETFWLGLPSQDNSLQVIPTAYVSARQIPVEWTQEWLSRNNFPYAPVYHTNGKSKVDILSELGIETMVEDCPEHYFAINKAGIPTYLYSQPYNVNIEAEQHRIDKLSDLILK